MSDKIRPTDDDEPLIPWRRLGALVENRGWAFALCIVLLGFALRAIGLNDYWVNPDEGLNYSIASWSSFSEFWREVQDNAHPPLYYLLLWGMDFLGTDVTWFRMLSLIPGCISIFGVYLLGREVSGTWVGLLAALLTAVSPSAIELSQVMRPYMFQVAGITFALYFLVRYLRAASERGLHHEPTVDLWLYVSFMVVALLTHYSSLIVMGGIGIVLASLLLAHKIPRSELRRLLLAHTPIVLTMTGLAFHLSALMGSDLQVQAQTHSLAQHMVTDVASIWLNFLRVLRYEFGLWSSGPMVLLLLAGLIILFRERKYAAFGLPIAVLGLAILAAAMQQYPFGVTRHVAYLLPIVVVPIAMPVAAGLRGRPGVAIATVAVVLGLVLVSRPLSKALGAAADGVIHLATPERLLPRENLERLRQKLGESRADRRPILMGLQTYYSLIPLFDEVRADREWQAGEFFEMEWGRSVVLVNVAWKMTTKPEPADPRESFYGFLQRIDAVLPQLNIMTRTESTVLVAGWETGLVFDLADFDSSNPQEIREIMVPGYLAALEVNLKKFVDSVRD